MKQIQYSYDGWNGESFHFYFTKEDDYCNKDWNICTYFLKYKHPNYIYIDMPETWEDYIWNIISKCIDILSVILEFISVLIFGLMIVGCWIFLIGKLFS